MSTFRTLSPKVSASPQITADDVAEAARNGFSLIVNNRPDGEEDGQPTSDEIAAAASEHGLEYVHIPVTGGGMGADHVERMADALANADGPVLAYCRSGTRSTFLWALAQASRGESPEDIIAAAAAAGYDVSPISGVLLDLARRAAD